jgi:hypothetical protein
LQKVHAKDKTDNPNKIVVFNVMVQHYQGECNQRPNKIGIDGEGYLFGNNFMDAE